MHFTYTAHCTAVNGILCGLFNVCRPYELSDVFGLVSRSVVEIKQLLSRKARTARKGHCSVLVSH